MENKNTLNLRHSTRIIGLGHVAAKIIGLMDDVYADKIVFLFEAGVGIDDGCEVAESDNLSVIRLSKSTGSHPIEERLAKDYVYLINRYCLISAITNGAGHVFLFTALHSLGGFVLAELTKGMADNPLFSNMRVSVISQLPFKFEGKSRNVQANNLYQIIKENVPNTHVVDLDGVMKKGGYLQMTIEEVFKQGEMVIAKDTAVQFVYIKATDGATWQDNRYEFNLTNARKQGIKVGTYHYFRMTSVPQAQFANLKKMMKKGDQDLIPMIDVELYKNKKGYHMDKYYTNNKQQKAEIVANLRTLLTLVEKEYGCKPMIYCTPASYNHILKGNFKGYKLYVGRYGGSGPGVPGWTIWQYSEKGRIVGMHKNCDVARFAKDSGIEDIAMPQPRQKKAKNAPKN